MDKLRGGVQTAGARVAPVPARWRPRRLPAGLAVAGAVTLPHPTLLSLGVSIRTGREWQHNDRTLANGEGWSTGWPASGTCTGAGPHSMFGYPPKAGPGHLGMLCKALPMLTLMWTVLHNLALITSKRGAKHVVSNKRPCSPRVVCPFRKRAVREPDLGAPQRLPKKVRFVFDISGSM